MGWILSNKNEVKEIYQLFLSTVLIQTSAEWHCLRCSGDHLTSQPPDVLFHHLTSQSPGLLFRRRWSTSLPEMLSSSGSAEQLLIAAATVVTAGCLPTRRVAQIIRLPGLLGLQNFSIWALKKWSLHELTIGILYKEKAELVCVYIYAYFIYVHINILKNKASIKSLSSPVLHNAAMQISVY